MFFCWVISWGIAYIWVIPRARFLSLLLSCWSFEPRCLLNNRLDNSDGLILLFELNNVNVDLVESKLLNVQSLIQRFLAPTRCQMFWKCFNIVATVINFFLNCVQLDLILEVQRLKAFALIHLQDVQRLLLLLWLNQGLTLLTFILFFLIVRVYLRWFESLPLRWSIAFQFDWLLSGVFQIVPGVLFLAFDVSRLNLHISREVWGFVF